LPCSTWNLRPAGKPDGRLVEIDAPCVLLADDLLPSLAGQIDRALVRALVLESGSRTHHTAIIARSMGLPAVAAVKNATALVRPGAVVLVDGTTGEVVIEVRF